MVQTRAFFFLSVFEYTFHKYPQHSFDDHIISVQSCCYMPLTLKNARNVKVKYFSVKQQSTKNVCEWQICTPCTVKSEKEWNQRRGMSKEKKITRRVLSIIIIFDRENNTNF